MTDIRRHIDLIEGLGEAPDAAEVMERLRQILSGPELEAEMEFARRVGGYIHQGAVRDVFECRDKPYLVIKVECDFEIGCRDQNTDEYEVWQALRRRPEIAKWFAPCHAISKQGWFLVQTQCAALHRMPTEYPRFFNEFFDIKLNDIASNWNNADNWGTLDGRPVCLDYAVMAWGDEASGCKSHADVAAEIDRLLADPHMTELVPV